ncbi:protein HOTHEAD-like [Andrographis paniculata]|uniref:protein HOTHEAD-like n=1 Tax=Andrographis paniculata TaxID=175694 RepID=UPI0021E7A175|nr:protein HOTHEAD-like [Andrographis paniculata]
MDFGSRFLIAALAASVGIIFVINGFCFAEKAPYTFTKEATSAPPATSHDYIVIGGGTAGCALAATLAAAGDVLLLERGGLPYNNPNITNKSGFPLLLMDTSPNSPMQMFISTDGVFNHRARVLGGGSAVNGGFVTRAGAEYVRRAGWDPRLVKESYEWAEAKVAFRPRVTPWQAAVRDGLLNTGVLPDRGFTFEHLLGTKISGSLFDGNGHRHTAADLLEYADPAKIAVYLHSTVQKILFHTSPGKRPRAYGVVYKDSAGMEHMAYLNSGTKNEIILSAGALGSPQLLMLSGVGPADHLKGFGIDVVLDQKMVGGGMSDNPRNVIVIPSAKPVDVSLIETVGITAVGSFIETVSGFSELAWVQNFDHDFRQQLANLTFRPFKNPRNESFLKDPYIQAGAIFEKVIGPFSTGHLQLQSNNPDDNPRVTFNYFQDPRDLKRCVEGMKIIKDVVESKPISASSFEQFCIDTVVTIWHYHGGCHVGSVVDRDYKVIGVDALRVVDGSTLSRSPGANPQDTLMMLGRYIGKKILQKRK